MLNKKSKKASKENSNTPSSRMPFAPFTNIRKSLRRLKQRRKTLPTQSTVTSDESIDNCENGNVMKNFGTKGENISNGLEKKQNVRKPARRNRLKNEQIFLSKIDTNCQFNIIEWSSCESLPDNEKVKARKHDSLRRSRASILVPISSFNGNNEPCELISHSKTKITRYNSLNILNCSKLLVTQNKWYSTHNMSMLQSKHFHSSGEIVPYKEKLVNTETNISPAKRKRVNNKGKRFSHSLSLPNIFENKSPENLLEVNIEIDDDCNMPSINTDETVDAEMSITKNDRTVDNHQKFNKMSNCVQIQKDLESSDIVSQNTVDKQSISAVNLQNKGFSLKLFDIYSSSPLLNRPPVPSVPKPITRRDRLLKSASSEGLSSNRKKILTEVDGIEKEILSDALSDSEYLPPVNNNKTNESSPLSVRSISDVPAFLMHNKDVWKKSLSCYKLPLAIAEAVWDHTTLNDDELTFSSGDVITVLFMEDDDWWWGAQDDQEGWFPASYARLRVIQEIYNEDKDVVISEINNNKYSLPKQGSHLSLIGLHNRSKSNDEVMTVRAKCIEELLNTEKDYVKMLKNIIEGYLFHVREDKYLFTEEDALVIFGNIEELYAFHKEFVKELQSVIKMEAMQTSLVGNVFLKHKSMFEIYSNYCNNQPRSSARLSSLTKDKKYSMFFETCRLRQNMIRLSLDGFLLSPVQRICKYPLQLKELLKHTDCDHMDYDALCDARICMQNVASLINERKRRLENVNKLARWQLTVLNWKDEDLVLKSSDLIHKGCLNKVTNGKDTECIVFLFDHQLIYFKQDSAKRSTLTYSGRINLDEAVIEDVADNTFYTRGEGISNAWKIWNSAKRKWCYFYVNSTKKKENWLKALQDERKHVQDELDKGFIVLPEVRLASMENAYHKHQVDLKSGRTRRKSISIYYSNLDTYNPYAVQPKFSDDSDIIQTVTKRTNKARRNRSFRLSLQGSFLEKYFGSSSMD